MRPPDPSRRRGKVQWALGLLALAACSSDEPEADPSVDFADFFDEIVEPGETTEPGAAGNGSGASGCSEPSEVEATCVGQNYAGESIPLDIFIVFDQSGSMCSCIDPVGGQLCPDPDCRQTRLDAIREATAQFLEDPKSAGMGVGLTYFGRQPIGQASCELSDYQSAAVPIGALPEHAPAVLASLGAIAPTGETPTGPAIRGACDYAQAWQASQPHHTVVLLLLTDGKPEAPVTCQNGAGACCPSLDDAVLAAEQCRSNGPDIKTYVLGVGPLLENLEQIAVAGGTERAYLVEGGDVSAQVLQALNRIRGDAAIPCQLQLPPAPPGQALATDEVNLSYANAECASTLFYSVQDRAQCGTEDGWYYDDPSNPQTIALCPASCDRVSGPGGQLSFSVGCATQIRIR